MLGSCSVDQDSTVTQCLPSGRLDFLQLLIYFQAKNILVSPCFSNVTSTGNKCVMYSQKVATMFFLCP